MSANVTQIKVFAKERSIDLQEEVFKAMANEQIICRFYQYFIQMMLYTLLMDQTDKADRS